ncbi:helix-turn-helix domain-containing protein [Flavobacterium sp.]|uniref:helix-turn-helix domain-containing protein n=1 Tax=Flavobacterium sp. TaxID=239 RepID=UPI0031E3A613
MQKDKFSSGRIAVSDEFQEVFSHFYFAENNSDITFTKKLLPSYQTIMIFSFGESAYIHSEGDENIEVEKCIVLGPIKKAFDYSQPAGNTILVANFKDDAFYRFFGSAALAENLPIDPNDLLSENCFTALWHKLNEIENKEEQVECILEFCRPYLRKRNPVTGQLIELKNTAYNPIKKVADETKQSERAIQLTHKKQLGYSAKEINRYLRFLKAIEMMQDIACRTSKNDWFEIVGECGYYDQSQLINDFKYYINLTPARYLKLQCSICNPVG